MNDGVPDNTLNERQQRQCFLRVSIGGEILAKDIIIELDVQNRPKTCESFLSLCADRDSIRRDLKGVYKGAGGDIDGPIRTSRNSPQPTYRGCEFHRIVPGFCVQAGDWERFDGTGGYSPLFGRNWRDEKDPPANDKHDREGIVSMANAGKPNTNGSQFFVTLRPQPHLNGKHIVFGRVISGIESVRKMVEVERGEKDRPVSLQRIVIEDCGQISPRRHKNHPENDEEDADRSRSRSKKHRKEHHRKRSKRKKHDRKHHRCRRHNEDSSVSRNSSDDCNSDSDDSYQHSVSGKRKGSHRERRSRKSREGKRRRNSYKSSDLSCDRNDGRSINHRGWRSSEDEEKRSSKRKRSRKRQEK